MRALQYFDVSLHTAYARAKELALAQHAVPLLTAGSIRTEARAGGRCVYRYRYDAGGKRVTEYLGAAADAATTAKLEQAKQEMDEQAVIVDYCRMQAGFACTNSRCMRCAPAPTIPGARRMCCRRRCWRRCLCRRLTFC